MLQGNLNQAIKKDEKTLSLKGKKPAWLYQQLGDAYIKNKQRDVSLLVIRQYPIVLYVEQRSINCTGINK